MMYFLERIAKLVKAGQDMAGGRKRGQVVFWIGFIILVAIGLKPAYDSIDYVFSHFSTTPIILNIIVSIIVALISAILLFAVGSFIGLIIGLPIRIGLATPVNNRIVDMLNELIVLLENNLKKEPNSKNVKQLLANAEDLKKRWYTSRMTRFIGLISIKPSEPKKAAK